MYIYIQWNLAVRMPCCTRNSLCERLFAKNFVSYDEQKFVVRAIIGPQRPGASKFDFEVYNSVKNLTNLKPT